MMNSLVQPGKPTRTFSILVNSNPMSSRPNQELTLLNQILYICLIGSGELHFFVPLQRMVVFSCNHWRVVELDILFEDSSCCASTFRNFRIPNYIWLMLTF